MAGTNIAPNEDSYLGWHEGYVNATPAYSVHWNGLHLGDGFHSQILNGLVNTDDPGLTTSSTTLGTLITGASVKIISATSGVLFQVPVTTTSGWATIEPSTRKTVSGGFALTDNWMTSQTIGSITKEVPMPLSELLAALDLQGDFRYSGFGIQVDDSTIVENIVWDGTQYDFIAPITVCASGCNQTTIQAAIDSAISGDTINVAAGTYTETVNINKSVILLGAKVGVNPSDGSWNDTRTNTANESIIHGAVNLSLSNTITIDGFTIERATGNEGHILIGGGQPAGVGTTSQFTIQNNRIIGSRSTGTTWGGIHTNFLEDAPSGPYLYVGSSATIQNNRVEIAGTASGNGILINRLAPGTDTNSALSITGNYIGAVAIDNPDRGDGISLQKVKTSTGLAQITGNYLVGSNISLYRTLGANVANNELVSPTEDGIWLTGGDVNITIDSNIITGGTASAVKVEDAFSFGANSGVTITDNTLQGNAYGVYIAAGSVTDTVEVHTNAITGNTTNGVFNDPSSGGSVDATNNWWGDASGPFAITTPVLNPTGTGDSAEGNVIFNPWYIDLGMTTTNVVAVTTAPVNLLSVLTNNFVILSETGITNVHTSAITGNIGDSPGTAAQMDNVFCSEITGTIYGVDAAYTGSGDVTCFAGNPPLANKTLVNKAVVDMVTAYVEAAGRPALTSNTNLYGGNLGGRTFTPGLYKWTTNVTIPTNVTLSGGANDVWIFQIAENLSIASAKEVILIGGAQASNVFWQVGGGTGATLGTTATFNGTILSAKQIILQTGAVLNGRALAQTKVVLDQNIVTASTPAAPVLITITVSPAAPSIVTGNTQTFTTSGLDQYNAAFATTTTWTSSDPSIATIDSTTGLATGISAGMVTVTASSTGSSVFGTTTLTVTSPPPPPSGGGSRRATPAVPANVATPDGCAPGNRFSTTTGRNCNAATPATPAIPATTVTTTTSNQGQVLGAEVFNFLFDLGVGSRHADVIKLQQFLIDGGYGIPAGATGYFGLQTKAAVTAFQAAKGIANTGYVGPLTRGELNKGSMVSAVAKTNLTGSQADAIISLIESFGADVSTVAKVKASLGR